MACGEVFRNLSIDTELGRTFIEYSSQGKLVPDEPTLQLWRHTIEANEQAGSFKPDQDLLVLDGIPRDGNRAKILSDTLDLRATINLRCGVSDKLVNRLQRRPLRENGLDAANRKWTRKRL